MKGGDQEMNPGEITVSRNDAPLSKADQARALIAEIRDDLQQGFEKFYNAGMKLKQIQAHELWKDLGYASFKDCLRQELDMSKSRAYQLLAAAELRPKLPQLPESTNCGLGREWSEGTVRELLRLETRHDQVRVAGKIRAHLEHNPKEKLTAKLTREFVDKDKGHKPLTYRQVLKAEREWRKAPYGAGDKNDWLTAEIAAETEWIKAKCDMHSRIEVSLEDLVLIRKALRDGDVSWYRNFTLGLISEMIARARHHELAEQERERQEASWRQFMEGIEAIGWRLNQKQARASATYPENLKVLGLKHPVTRDELRAAYRGLAMTHHPDHGGTAAEFQRIQRAYDEASRQMHNLPPSTDP
jgi:hypothetical protein